MDSTDDEFDIAAEFEAWAEKLAAEDGIDLIDPYAGELEAIKRFQRNPSQEDFEWLHNAHKPLINAASYRYLSSTTLPKAAVKGFALQRYTHALKTYNPDRGAQFKSYLYTEMQRVGRYAAKYSNVGRVAEGRASLIPLLQDTETTMRDQLGRPPSDSELSDEMRLSAQDIADFKKKLKHITPKNIGTLRKELRQDLTAESAGGESEIGGESNIRRQAVFLHGSLNPTQQLVLEHTYEGFGKPLILDDVELARTIGESPQKVRAIKGQIRRRVQKFW